MATWECATAAAAMTHPNGARLVTESVICAADPGDVIPGGVAPAVPSMAGFTVAVTDLDAVRDLLADGGVPFREHQGRLVVGAADAGGSAVLFEA